MPFFGKVQIHIFIKRRGHRTDQFATIVIHKSLKKKMYTPFKYAIYSISVLCQLTQGQKVTLTKEKSYDDSWINPTTKRYYLWLFM